jgi:hypothetical protein
MGLFSWFRKKKEVAPWQPYVAVIDRSGDQQDVNFYREMEDGSLVEVPWPCGVPSWGVSEGRLRELGYRVVRT